MSAGCDAEGNLLANGMVISELQGLKWMATASKKIAIATDYQVTKDANQWGPYNGPAYLWLNGKTTAVHFVIPAVEPGTTIRMGLESHKPSEARGVDCYVAGTKLEKEPEAYPTTYEVYEWTTPEGEEPMDVDVQPSNGTHIYFIEVGEDTGSGMDEINIAYLYDSSYNGAKDADKNPCGWLANGGLDADPVYATLQTYNVVAIDYNGQSLTSAELNDSLLTFDVVVAGEAVSSGNALAKDLKEIVNKVPMLNLKSFMYKSGVWSWGAGQNPSPKNGTVVVAEDYLEDPLFADLAIDEDGSLTLFDCDDPSTLNGNLVQGYTVNDDALIAGDEVLATVGGINAIHRHGQKNQYLLVPLSSDNMDLVNGNVYGLIDNAVRVLAATKSKVQTAAAPVISQEHNNQSTTVTITCATSGSTIYYTMDGSEPTTQSTVYAEPLVVSEDGLVIKAMAVAHGYNDSNVTTATISVMSQAPRATMETRQYEGYTEISFTSDTENLNTYFSFNGVASKTGTQLYLDEPIVLTEPATITYFSACEGMVESQPTSEVVTVNGFAAAKDTVAHFTANEAEWFADVTLKNYLMEDEELPTANWAAKAAYYWGKSAWSYYSTEVDHTEAVMDEDGNPVKDIDGNDSIKIVYKPDPTAVKYVYSNVDKQWRLRSQGQLFTGETNVAASMAVGNAETGYYAESAIDLIGEPSKGKMTFGGKGSGEPYSASVESTEKFQAPFDIVTYTTNGGGSAFNVEIQTSADGENWTKVGELPVAQTQRYYKKGRAHVTGNEQLYVRVAQVGGSTKAQLYDIYVITVDTEAGIEEVKADQAVSRHDAMYDLYGRQLSQPMQGALMIVKGQKMILK